MIQVKSLKTPPKGVKLTMEVCCIMFDVKPIKVKDPDSGKKVRQTKTHDSLNRVRHTPKRKRFSFGPGCDCHCRFLCVG